MYWVVVTVATVMRGVVCVRRTFDGAGVCSPWKTKHFARMKWRACQSLQEEIVFFCGNPSFAHEKVWLAGIKKIGGCSPRTLYWGWLHKSSKWGPLWPPEKVLLSKWVPFLGEHSYVVKEGAPFGIEPVRACRVSYDLF